MDLFQIYPQIKDLIALSRRKKYGLFLVGGFLRDYYFGKASQDFDFAVKGNAIALAKAWSKAIKGAYVLLDDEHGSARVVLKVKGSLWTYDFTDLRAKTIQGDLKLRDFTVNALCLDLYKYNPAKSIESQIIDLHKSVNDIKSKRLRIIAPSVFTDDPLRLMRAYSLKSMWGLRLDKEVVARIKKDKELIRTVAMERIREELFKVLNSSAAFETISEMDRIGLLPLVIPQITVMYDVEQGGYHHLDVWQHTLDMLGQLEEILDQEKDPRILQYFDEEIGGAHTRRSLLKLSVLLHDIGKPETRKPEEDRVSFHGHEHVGERITRLVAKHLKVSVKERYFLEDTVRMHLRPGYLSNFATPSEKAIFRYFRDTHSEGASIAFLALADQAATRGKLTTKAKAEHHASICHLLIERFFKAKEKPQAPKRLLTGNDLIKKLKLKPSPLFGKILDAVEEAQALGKIKTPQDALGLARKIAKV